MMPMAAFAMKTGARAPWDRALVTGGAGFVGSHLCTRLLDAGVEVDCLDDLSTGRAGNVAHLAGRHGFRFLERDVAGPGLPGLLDGPYDLVLHLAGPARPGAGWDRPPALLDAASTGTRAALDIAGRDGARFLLASAPPPDADDPFDAHGAYAEALRFSEALVAARAGDPGAHAGIVRLFTACGPRMRTDDGTVPGAFLAQALAGRPVTLAGDGGRRHSLCYVDDLVDGVLLVAAGRSVRPVDLGGDETPTEAEIARRVIELTGSDAPVTCTGRPPGDPAGPRPATGFAQEIFGWMPGVTWQEGLARTVAALTERPGPVPATVVRADEGGWA
ncbi:MULTISPECIES: NAD-dependent epimerase/dehydratase family protein [Streptomyces]|uniref:dTDP-glucose 4,6-dehydratase n=2 Tax=Streptomyces TaxID=1883 RepID=A0ABT9L893_STRGD|nr:MULTISPECIES: NAD-dependent epimerase/dehydratase family protein [Streptomyces]MDP9679879.1 dTDP-glucose 4,6-dehydratase [Streptomyces griseoviridis]GGT23421.1 epimerase [Streptomyces griseoviridis]GGU65662.1 epimerase [Streptomyces daghestanicus]GHI30153.1 epimerase [Streptomyces daghestanicus]